MRIANVNNVNAAYLNCPRKEIILCLPTSMLYNGAYENCPRKGLIISLPMLMVYTGAYEDCPRKMLIICILLTEGVYMCEGIICERTHRQTANAKDVWCWIMNQAGQIAIGTWCRALLSSLNYIWRGSCHPHHFQKIGRYMTNWRKSLMCVHMQLE